MLFLAYSTSAILRRWKQDRRRPYQTGRKSTTNDVAIRRNNASRRILSGLPNKKKSHPRSTKTTDKTHIQL